MIKFEYSQIISRRFISAMIEHDDCVYEASVSIDGSFKIVSMSRKPIDIDLNLVYNEMRRRMQTELSSENGRTSCETTQ